MKLFKKYMYDSEKECQKEVENSIQIIINRITDNPMQLSHQDQLHIIKEVVSRFIYKKEQSLKVLDDEASEIKNVLNNL